VRCTLTNARTRVTCHVTFASTARARLVRNGRTVARGRFAKRWVTLASVSKGRLAKGTYTLIAGKRVLRITIR
jgi:hypothetical protein